MFKTTSNAKTALVRLRVGIVHHTFSSCNRQADKCGHFGATIKLLILAWKQIRWQERVTELQLFTKGASFV